MDRHHDEHGDMAGMDGGAGMMRGPGGDHGDHGGDHRPH
jgi:hypothetical protein